MFSWHIRIKRHFMEEHWQNTFGDKRNWHFDETGKVWWIEQIHVENVSFFNKTSPKSLQNTSLKPLLIVWGHPRDLFYRWPAWLQLWKSHTQGTGTDISILLWSAYACDWLSLLFAMVMQLSAPKLDIIRKLKE